MLSYQVNPDIVLAMPRPQKDAPILFKLLDTHRQSFEYYLPWLSLTGDYHDEVRFLEQTNRHLGQGDSLNLVIWFKHQIVGMISFNHFDHTRDSADIGYWLGQEFQGQGIVTKAVKGLCQLGFESYDLNRIIIQAATDNEASNRVAKNAGFTFEGIMRQNEKLHDGFHDENIYSLLRSDMDK